MPRLRVLVFLVFLLAIGSFSLFSGISFLKTSAIGPLVAPAGTQSKFQKIDVGVLAIFKGEAPYLAEWLEYHLLIGVQHFWLASNDCLDEAASNATLLPYVQAGIVTLDRRFLCDQRFQRRAYNTIATELRESGVVTWLGVFDVDEFIVIADHNQTITDVLKGYGSNVAAVALNRPMFGPSGFETKPAGSVISSYVLHAHPFRQLDNGVLLQVKMLIRLEHCVHFQIHGCDVSVNNASIVNTLKEPFAYYTARGKLRYPVVSAFVGMWQNHYVTRSRQEYELKNARGDAQQIKRIDTRFPAGVDDVLNTYIITSVAARLARMHEDGYARQAEWLRKLLLSGAPNITSERLAAWPPENVFGDTFIRVGMQKQLSGEWPRF